MLTFLSLMIHLDRNRKVAREFGALFDELDAAKRRA